MNKLKVAKYTSKFFVLSIAALVGAAAGHQLKKPEPKIKIVRETKTVYKKIFVPQTQLDYINCYNSNIEITGKVDMDWLNVKAKDNCKQSEKAFKIKSEGNWKYYTAFAVGGCILGLALLK